MKFLSRNDSVLHYQWMNQGKGRTFIFINSLGTDFRIWDDVIDNLRSHGNILLFDKRGHGLSDCLESNNKLEAYAEDVIFLMQHLSIDRGIVIGISVGGMIAQLLAFHYSDKFEKVVLCDTCYKIGTTESWDNRILQVRNSGLASISSTIVQRWLSNSFRQKFPERVAAYRNMLERTSSLGYIQTCLAIRDTDIKQQASQIKIPTLCVVGDEDLSTTPSEVKSLSDLIPDSIFQVISDSAHLPCTDNPTKLSKIILDFINQ